MVVVSNADGLKWKSWKKEKPNEVNRQFVWLTFLDCYCCIDMCGIGYVTRASPDRTNPEVYYKIDEETLIWWEAGTKIHYRDDGQPIIDFWAYIDTPALNENHELIETERKY